MKGIKGSWTKASTVGKLGILGCGGLIGFGALIAFCLTCVTTLSVAGFLPTLTPKPVVAQAQATPSSTVAITFTEQPTSTEQASTTPLATDTASPTDTQAPSATPAPSDTALPSDTPQPTDTPAPSSTATATFSVPTSGLGVTRSTLQSYYESKGFVFEDPDTSLGEPHVHGDAPDGVSIDLTGPPDNLISVELDLPENEKGNSAPLLALVALVVPDWQDGPNWVQTNQALSVKSATGDNPVDIEYTSFRNLEIQVVMYDTLGATFDIDDSAWRTALLARTTQTPLAPAASTDTPIVSAPTATAAPALSIAVVSLTSPASRNSNATLVVRTTAGANCAIVVNYKSGPSKAQGLGPETADSNGRCAWTWKVGGNTTRGTWSITVTVSLNGQSNSISIPFQVQ